MAKLDSSVLMLVLNLEDEEMNKIEQRNSETEARLAELMQLFQEVAKCPSLRTKLIHSFKEHTMRKLLGPILDTEGSANREWPGNIIQVISIARTRIS